MSKTCIMDGCSRPHYAKGLCSVHYQERLRRERRAQRVQKEKIDSMPNEIWAIIPDTGGRYSVSSKGRVKRNSYKFVRSNGDNTLYSEHLSTLQKDKDGYLNVSLSYGGKMRKMRVHRLVAMVFIGMPPEDKPLINHKNGIKDDNRAENLEWVNADENQRHRVYTLNRIPPFGLKPVQCIETGEIFPSVHAAARAVGLHSSNLAPCLKPHSRHTAAGYHWEYA